jgi:hypothetical protein
MSFLNYKKGLFFLAFSMILIFSCTEEEQRKSDILEFIAPNPGVIFQMHSYEDWKENLKEQSFLEKNKSISLLSFLNTNSWESIMDMPEHSLITYHKISKNDIAETLIFKQKDSIVLKVKAADAKNYDGVEITRLVSDQNTYFYAKLYEHYVFSTSSILLENIIRNYNSRIEPPSSVKKLSEVLSDNTPSILINTKLIKDLTKDSLSDLAFLPFLEMSDYVGFDINLSEEEIFLSGIILESEDQAHEWQKFSNVEPDKSVVSEVIPTSFVNAHTTILSNYKELFELEKNVNTNRSSDSLWNGISEVAKINFSNTHAYAFVSKDIDDTFSYLNKRSKRSTTFGAIDVFQLTTKFEQNANISAYFDKMDFEFFTIVKDIVIASKELKTIEDMLIEINNNNVLSNQENFKYHLDYLNTKSSMLWFTNLSRSDFILNDKLSEEGKKEFKKVDWSKHEYLISQMIVEDNFAYFNILQRQTKSEASGTKVQQVVRVKSEDGFLTAPQFFKNWRTGQYDVVYQDNKNVLHLKDTKGNLVWSKRLDEPIVGQISSIDIYQNKRIQLAFATKSKVYILDKNGREVSPFPLKIKDEITQGLSVFDYDKNGNYRFVVVNDRSLTMYDKEAKKVRGFKYKKAKSHIKHPVKHIRMSGKDYIMVQDEAGKLEILNRQGRTRVKLDKNFNHYGGEWYAHKGKFVSLNADGKLVFIDTRGGIDVKDYNWLNPKFTADSNTLVSMSENILRVNSNNAELPYGLYSTPKVTQKYVGIADEQEQKVYLFNKNGELLKGFPVYGKKLVDMYYTQRQIALLCTDENDAFMVYFASLR